MNIGEFFVSLGVKGGDKAAGTVENMKDKMEGLGEMSLKTKVAIAGVVYGLQKMVADSANIGSGLSKFDNYTGLSTKALQQYQYAAMQVGVSNEEVTGSIVNLQRAMAKMQFRGEAPEGINNLINILNGDFDIERAYKDPFYVLQQLQKALSQNKDIGTGIMNQIVETFGLSQDMVQALRREAFNPSVMREAIVYSDREISNLQIIDAMWSNIGNRIEKAYGKFFSTGEGREFVTQIGEITDSLIELTNALLKLGNQLHIFEGISAVIKGLGTWANIGTTVARRTGRDIDLIKSGQYNRTKDGWLSEAFPSIRLLVNEVSDMFGMVKNNAAPSISPSTGRAPQSISVNQEFTFMGGGEENVSKVTRSFEDGVREAFRQLPQSEAN